jgi:hypothetical protein
MSNGKGSKLRKGANLNSFRQNYDEICWKKVQQTPTVTKTSKKESK